jgi:D-lactate dehydrogenase
MLRAETLHQMKKGVFIINTSRGKLIHTTALLDALNCGHIGGGALHVYEKDEGVFFEDHSEEVMQDDVLSRLLTFPNVLITSHQAFVTEEALREIARVTVRNLLKFDNGVPFLPGNCAEFENRSGMFWIPRCLLCAVELVLGSERRQRVAHRESWE